MGIFLSSCVHSHRPVLSCGFFYHGNWKLVTKDPWAKTFPGWPVPAAPASARGAVFVWFLHVCMQYFGHINHVLSRNSFVGTYDRDKTPLLVSALREFLGTSQTLTSGTVLSKGLHPYRWDSSLHQEQSFPRKPVNPVRTVSPYLPFRPYCTCAAFGWVVFFFLLKEYLFDASEGLFLPSLFASRHLGDNWGCYSGCLFLRHELLKICTLGVKCFFCCSCFLPLCLFCFSSSNKSEWTKFKFNVLQEGRRTDTG